MTNSGLKCLVVVKALAARKLLMLELNLTNYLHLNNMPYQQRIATLTESHRLIDNVIQDMTKTPGFDEMKVNSLKKQKLIYKDDIRKFERAQQEHDKEMKHD